MGGSGKTTTRTKKKKPVGVKRTGKKIQQKIKNLKSQHVLGGNPNEVIKHVGGSGIMGSVQKFWLFHVIVTFFEKI
jgi:hypothetical protein